MAAKNKPAQVVKPSRAAGKVALYTLIEEEQQLALRVLSFMRQAPMADLVREAIDQYLAAKGPTPKEIENAIDMVRRSVRAK